MFFRDEFQAGLPNLDEIIEEVATLQIEICCLIESNISSIPPVIPLIVQLAPLYGLGHFDFFEEDEEVLPIVGINREKRWILILPIYHAFRP